MTTIAPIGQNQPRNQTQGPAEKEIEFDLSVNFGGLIRQEPDGLAANLVLEGRAAALINLSPAISWQPAISAGALFNCNSEDNNPALPFLEYEASIVYSSISEPKQTLFVVNPETGRWETQDRLVVYQERLNIGLGFVSRQIIKPDDSYFFTFGSVASLSFGSPHMLFRLRYSFEVTEENNYYHGLSAGIQLIF